jgi:6-phosphofructokinase
MSNELDNGRLGLLVGGGPAPGINGVISAVTIEARNDGLEVIGFKNGFGWLMKEKKDDPRQLPQDNPYFRFLTIEDVKDYALRGGSILGTSRANPTKRNEDMERVLQTLRDLNVTRLVTIGGDDTAFSGSQLYKKAGGAIKVAHVPKTIDNDLPLPESTPTFGFETARHEGVRIVRNLAEDARTTSRWYLVVSMGRAAGFLALGVGKAAAATLTIIPEEFRGRPISLDELCDILLGAIIKRRRQGAPFGVAVLAEGLLESIGEQGLLDALGSVQEIRRYGKIERDQHNHLRLGEIEFGRMIKDRLAEHLEELDLSVTLVDKELGYELRCADPIPFDAEYTRDLGYGAVKFLLGNQSSKFGAVISLVAGRLRPLPFEELIVPETGRMRPRKVDVEGEVYECARRYMIRLEPADFEAPQLLENAAAAGLTPERFRERFGYLVGLGERRTIPVYAIADDEALDTAQRRIEHLQQLLAGERGTARQQEAQAVVNAYRSEIERWQAAVLDYLTRPAG